MSFNGMLIHDVTIIKPGAMVDRYGDTIADWDHPTETASRWWLYQRRSEEDHAQGRDEHREMWRGFAPGTDDVRANYRIYWVDRDLTFEVDGPPQPTYRPASNTHDLHHLEVDLRHVAG